MADFRREINSNLRKIGPLIAQNEIQPSVIVDTSSGLEYKYIDRLFFGGGRFLGGERTMLSAETTEARKGNIHACASAVLARITEKL